MADGFKVVCTQLFLLAIIMIANSQQVYYSSQPTSVQYMTSTDCSVYMSPYSSSHLPSAVQNFIPTSSSSYPSTPLQSYQTPPNSQYTYSASYNSITISPSNLETVTYLPVSQAAVPVTSAAQYSSSPYPEMVTNTITANAFFLPPAAGSEWPKCTITYEGRTVEVPCYTYAPSDPIQVSAEKVTSESKSLTEEMVKPEYPCPLCAACQGNTPAPESPLINPPPPPSPVLPGILNQVPSPFPPAKAKPAQVAPVLPTALSQRPCLKSPKSKPKLPDGPLIYLPVNDEVKLLEMLLAGLC